MGRSVSCVILLFGNTNYAQYVFEGLKVVSLVVKGFQHKEIVTYSPPSPGLWPVNGGSLESKPIILSAPVPIPPCREFRTYFP